MNHRMLKLNIFLMAACTTGGLMYFLFGNIEFVQGLFNVNTLLFKGIAAAFFVLLGGLNLVFSLKVKPQEKMYPVLIAVSLAVSMAGDLTLGANFILGAALFASSHVLYSIAYSKICSFETKDLIYCGIVFVPSALFLLLFPKFEFGSGLMLGVCIVYALIISCMVGKAVANFVRCRNAVTITVLTGSVLFYISDFMLVLGQFSTVNDRVTFLEIPLFSLFCLMTYFPAQSVIAHSIYRFAQKTDNDN